MGDTGGQWEDELDALRTGPTQPFRAWNSPAIPNGRAGTYTIWRDEVFIYVGAAGRSLPEWTSEAGVTPGRPRGLRDRLSSHASGRRSGDQFCIYVFDRLVLPVLTQDQIQLASAGRLSLDGLTRDYIRDRLAYRYVILNDWRAAMELEDVIRKAGLANHRPLLNPIIPVPVATPIMSAGGASDENEIVSPSKR